MELTQYLLPNGRKEQVIYDADAATEEKAAKFVASGGKYECEVLSTGLVSLTACHTVDGETQDIAIELTGNDARIVDAVSRLVDASIKWLEASKKT